MPDFKHFRISVDLSAFFYDHRRVARIFVKRNLKTISDLHNRISNIFQITNFYLTTEGHFLPVSEDIRILSNNENVCVIPTQPQEVRRSVEMVTSSSKQTDNKNHKRALELIAEESGETSSPKKKKSKTKRNDEPLLSSSTLENETPVKKRKSDSSVKFKPRQYQSTNTNENLDKDNSEAASYKHLESIEDEISQGKIKNPSIVEREGCNIDSFQKLNEIKKNVKQITDEFKTKHSKESFRGNSNIKNVLPKLQNHIKNCNDSGRSNLPDTVRLSRHVDTPIKAFSKYTPPLRITDKYLAENRVNIVKIDIIKNNSMEQINGSCINNASGGIDSIRNMEHSKDLQNSDESCTPPKNYVKEVIETFETKFSPQVKEPSGKSEASKMEEKDVEVKQNTAEYVKQDEPPVNQNECAYEITENCCESKPNSDNLPDQKTISQNLNADVFITPKPYHKVEISSISLHDSSTDQDSSYNVSGNSSVVSTTPSHIDLSTVIPGNIARHIGGVGALIELLKEPDSFVSHDSDSSTQFVNKRKRSRKHRRKNKKTDDDPTQLPVNLDIPITRPMNVKACPSIHIKFEDNEVRNVGENADINNVNNTNSETADQTQISNGKTKRDPSLDAIVLSDENEDPIMENKGIFGKDSIAKAPLMTGKLEPKVGDVIAFKIIKLTDDYSPQVSDYIVGKLQVYLLDTKTVQFKILSGEDELKPATGKFSLNREDEDMDLLNLKRREFLWTDLLTPKLLYP